MFPGPTAGRKGAYELREAVRSQNVALIPCGRELGGKDCWKNVDIVSLVSSLNWLEEARVVVQPSCVEDHPIALLRAIQAGVPVITTERAGLAGMPGVTTVPYGDVPALSQAIAHSIEQRIFTQFPHFPVHLRVNTAIICYRVNYLQLDF